MDDFERIGNVTGHEGTLFLKLRARTATVHRHVYDCFSLYKHPSQEYEWRACRIVRRERLAKHLQGEAALDEL